MILLAFLRIFHDAFQCVGQNPNSFQFIAGEIVYSRNAGLFEDASFPVANESHKVLLFRRHLQR